MPSTVIRSFSYDPEARRLDVTFVSGRRYGYHEVPAELFEEMKLSFAKGEFFNRRIRGRFDFSPQAQEPAATVRATRS
jgi:hypothetical protein